MTFLGPALVTALGLLYMVNPGGLGDHAFKHLNRYPRIAYSAEAARRQAYALGRMAFVIGVGWTVWALLLDLGMSHAVKVAFLAVAVPSALALAGFTVVDTIRRAMGEGWDGRSL
ncbi:hypothetical protein GLX30_14415 [Streptomyces sp. Tu 2975]|uniref:hypothetical protein n=1 Tax=Streptomyces sp. Tu 2975 TaxID=2676871 RepID=UPI00135B1AB3|nr:hypothetical protein [Streptomyces sp. Tu 2975]QIP85019.1 hypothetical protein GLX30_14415 [Streptomyces sp. Tu 2975]